MHEIEQHGRFYFIRTEGKISIDWLRDITGQTLEPYGSEYERASYPCGTSSGSCSDYFITNYTFVSIHPDRICVLDNKLFLEKLSILLTTRPDLQELLSNRR